MPQSLQAARTVVQVIPWDGPAAAGYVQYRDEDLSLGALTRREPTPGFALPVPKAPPAACLDEAA